MVEARQVHPLILEPLGVLAETPPTSPALGLYLHVPFCTKRCYYCSFTTAPLGGAALTARYLDALRGELSLIATAPWAPGLRLLSVYLGGGTPSLLAPDELAGILDAVRDHFLLAPDAEITLECNPESVGRERLERYRAAGVNRVSLGVQSLDDGILAAIGRLHGAREAHAAFVAAREAAVPSVSVDLMYGLPGLGLDGWRRDVTTILAWEPDHLSAYGLTLDAESLWGATGVAGLPPDDTTVAQFWELARQAAARGYEHYEISNYARPGFRSVHNQIYWRRGEYLACGPGAAGFVGRVRWTNVKPVTRYCALLEDGRLPIDTAERLTPRQVLAERLFLGLRTSDGVPAAWLVERCAGEPSLGAHLERWRAEGLLADAGDRVRLTEAGFLVSDALFIHLL